MFMFLFSESHNIEKCRVLVVNSLCASKCRYIILVLQLPQNYISPLQKIFIDFKWQGRHWVKSDRLYLHKLYGCLGLVQLSRLHGFRLRFIHEYLYYDSHSCFKIENVFLEEFITLDILYSNSLLCLWSMILATFHFFIKS